MINVFIGGPLENQLVEGQPSLKELNMKYEYEIQVVFTIPMVTISPVSRTIALTSMGQLSFKQGVLLTQLV